jgi:hypothetical protein
MNGPDRYNFEQLREKINDELLNENMTKRLYSSTDAIFKIIDTIKKTEGKGWAAQVVDNNGNPILTPIEQQRFTEAFNPYINVILEFLDDNKLRGGNNENNVEKLSGMSKDFIKTKIAQVTGVVNDPTKMVGPDDLYVKIINKINNIDNTVNSYASKYGILRLEKDHDVKKDIRIIPKPAQIAISDGITALGAAAGIPINPVVTQEIMDKIKIPLRTIIFIIYLALDITRIVMTISDRTVSRKILSIVLAIFELLKGDWKKSILTFIGFYGMTPLLAGEIMKAFLTIFRQLSPQIQESITYGTLDVSKSLLIGILLSIFQVTAPEEIRLPLIGILENIAKKKAEMDGILTEEGLSARPKYLSPTFEDLNNIQAVMSDSAYICSCEFEELVTIMNKSSVMKIILQILRIPVTEEFRKYKCGDKPCDNFVTKIVKESLETQKREENLEKPLSIELPVKLNKDDILTKPINESSKNITQVNKIQGGRILHSRLKNKIIA